MTHEEYQRRRRELQDADSYDNPTYSKAVDLDGEYLRNMKLPEVPEIKFDGACQICHGDRTKCNGKCVPEINLSCAKHEWVYDDANGGYCEVCGVSYPEPARKRATLKEIKERHSRYSAQYHFMLGDSKVSDLYDLPANQAGNDISDLIAEVEELRQRNAELWRMIGDRTGSA